MSRTKLTQFGCLKGISPTYCLLDMIHTWLAYLDSPGRHLRLCFLDFSKAFDRIGYNVLLEKLLDLSVHTYLIPWIISFLTNRRQSIKLAGSTSDWLQITAGVPQGTKLAQILFLVMINNLNIPDLESRTWKYVDDVSLSEGLIRNSNSNIQTSLNTVASWSSSNWMKLNAKNRKELCGFVPKGTHRSPSFEDRWSTIRAFNHTQSTLSGDPEYFKMEQSYQIYCHQGF